MQTLAEKQDLSEVKLQLRQIADYVLRRHALTHADECNGRSMVHAIPSTLNNARKALQNFVQDKPDRHKDSSLLSKCLFDTRTHRCLVVQMIVFRRPFKHSAAYDLVLCAEPCLSAQLKINYHIFENFC